MNSNRITVGTVIISLCLLLTANASAQTWRRFTTGDGLADNNVNVMLKDRAGNLWVGTRKGLNQFNGIFTTHLDGVDIRFLLESSDGSIWAAPFFGGGLFQHDGTHWREHKLAGTSIQSLLESSDGTIWGALLVMVYGSTGGRVGSQPHEAFSKIPINSLSLSSAGSIWVITSGNELWQYDGAGWRQPELPKVITSEKVLWQFDGEQPELPERSSLKLLTSSAGSIWASTDSGLWQYDGIRWQLYEETAGKQFNRLLALTDGSIWASAGYDLWQYDGTRWQSHEEMAGKLITGMLESADGSIWVKRENTFSNIDIGGSIDLSELVPIGNGLWQYDRIKWQPHEEVADKQLYGPLASADGSIWVGTDAGVLFDLSSERKPQLWQYNGINWLGHPLPPGEGGNIIPFVV